MLLATGRGRYADEMERVLYNAIASGTSLAGDRFFYSNPLQLRDGHDGGDEDMPSERLEWYRCPCCPPNLARLVASLNGYVATERRRRPRAAPADRRRGDGRASGRARGAEHLDGISVGGDGVDRRRPPSTSGRLRCGSPAGAAAPRLTVAGEQVAAAPDADGYVRVRRAWRPGTERAPDAARCRARELVAHPRVDAVRGCVALGARARRVLHRAARSAGRRGARGRSRRCRRAPRAVVGPGIAGVPVALVGQGSVVRAGDGELYAEGAAADADAETVEVTAIPYFRWANRGPCADARLDPDDGIARQGDGDGS